MNIESYIAFKEHWPVNIIVNYIAYNNINKNINNNIQIVDKINLKISGYVCREICLCCDFTNTISIAHLFLKINPMKFGIPINISIVGRKIPILFFKKINIL